MKKVLFVASVVKTHIMVFHLPYLEWFKQNGYEVHVCAKNDYNFKEELKIPFCDKYFEVNFERFPLKFNNLKAYGQLKKIIKKNDYDIIHCHTPIGGVLTRIAALKSNLRNSKVIYTAHGFHFYKGAPLRNWLIYYPIEKFLAKHTDVLITINKEDYYRGKKFEAKKIAYVPGVGVDAEKLSKLNISRKEKREELGIADTSIGILSVGELSKRKNHEVIIRALGKINNPKIIYYICGEGKLENYLKNIAEKLNVNIKFLGYRKDIPEICYALDLYAFPSLQEGLPVALMEAMSVGMPIVCSNVRGNTDLIKEGNNGFLVPPDDENAFAASIKEMIESEELRKNMANENLRIIKNYDQDIIQKDMQNIYNNK